MDSVFVSLPPLQLARYMRRTRKQVGINIAKRKLFAGRLRLASIKLRMGDKR
jgi:hypothetical protein